MTPEQLALMLHNIDRAMATVLDIGKIERWGKLDPDSKFKKVERVMYYLKHSSFDGEPKPLDTLYAQAIKTALHLNGIK